MQTYSGKREKGHCVLVSNLTDPAGRLIAVTPGPGISCTPRGGDGTSLGIHLSAGVSEGNGSGLNKILIGTASIGVCLNMDRGYVVKPTNVDTGSNLSVLEFCHSHDILTLYRFLQGEQYFRYDPSQDILIAYQGSNNPTFAANSARIATSLRPASENCHLLKKTYKQIGTKVKSVRLNRVGVKTVNKYSRKYDVVPDAEVAETSKLHMV